MKKVLTIVMAASMMFTMLVGCSESDEHLEQRCVELRNEIAALQEQKAAIEAEVVDAKEANGTAKYVVTISIKQAHFTMDIKEHIKDSMNEITMEIPVDKEYYDNLSVGDVINGDFRMGSLIMRGSFGSWRVVVDSKEIR